MEYSVQEALYYCRGEEMKLGMGWKFDRGGSLFEFSFRFRNKQNACG